MKISSIMILFFVLVGKSFGQTYDSLPKNVETKKVSLLKVVELKNVSKEEIYVRVNNWYDLKRTSINESDMHKLSKKNTDFDGDFHLYTIQYENFDGNNMDSLFKNKQKLIYKVGLSQYKANGTRWLSGIEYASFIILIKDGKCKIELTDFTHLVDVPSFRMNDFTSQTLSINRSGEEWKYEDDKAAPSKKKWVDIRLEGVNKYQKFMNNLIDYLNKPNQTNLDF